MDKDHINPSHYKGLLPAVHPKNKDWEYIEIMEVLLADMDGYEGHLYGQVQKYLLRLGKKDAKLQDLRKAIWYAQKLEELYENQQGTVPETAS